jgi:hypothetical protein
LTAFTVAFAGDLATAFLTLTGVLDVGVGMSLLIISNS